MNLTDMGLSSESRTAGAVLGSLVTAAGIAGNLMVLAVVIFCKNLRIRNNLFIGSMAAVELAVCVCVYPFYINAYVEGRWQFGDRYCLFTVLADSFATTSCVIHIMCITLYRYLLIEHPKIHSCLTKKGSLAAVVTLMIAVPFVGVCSTRLKYMFSPSPYRFWMRPMICVNIMARNTKMAISSWVIIFSAALLCIVACYARILLLVKRFRRRVQVQTINEAGNAQGAMMTRIRQETRLLQTVFVIYLMFVLLYIPYPIIVSGPLPEYLHVVANTVYWCGPAVNGIIYGIMHPDFRKAYGAVFSSIFKCN